MEKNRKPLSSKKPPKPMDGHKVIEDWIANRTMPGIQPLIREIDKLITDLIPNLHYSVKWGKAYYGTREHGWVIEVAAYHVSANIVFLSGAVFDPQPPMGTGNQSRYVKLKSTEDLQDESIINYIKQAGRKEGWK